MYVDIPHDTSSKETYMTYAISWLVENRVLKLTLPKLLNQSILEDINREVTEILDAASEQIIVYMDTASLSVSYQTADILRNTQSFKSHKKLDCITVLAGNKLNRLIILMAFSTALVPVMQFDDTPQICQYLERRGITLSESHGCN